MTTTMPVLTPAASTALYLATTDWPARRRQVPAVTFLVGAALATGCAAALLWNAALFNALATQWNMNDFGKFYYATIGWRSGADLYAPNAASVLPMEQAAGLQLLNMNPPHFHLLMLPLSWLPPAAALQVWMMASLFAGLLSVLLIAAELRITWTPLRALGVVFAALVFSATQGFFATGQVSLLMLLPMTAAWVAARHGQWGRAGLWIGACAGVKPFLLVFLPYLALTRRGRALAGAVASIAGSVLAGMLVFGTSAHASWIAALSASQQWAWFPMGVSLNAVFTRLLAETPVYAPLAVSGWLARLWVIPAAAIGFVSLVLAARPRATAPYEPVADRDPHSVDAPFATLLLAAQLMSPLGWVYYLWWPAGPVAALALRGSSQAWASRVLLGAVAALMVPSAVTFLFQPSAGATLTVGSLYFWATLSLWTVAAFQRPKLRIA